MSSRWLHFHSNNILQGERRELLLQERAFKASVLRIPTLVAMLALLGWLFVGRVY